jgi:hypothetical protein
VLVATLMQAHRLCPSLLGLLVACAPVQHDEAEDTTHAAIVDTDDPRSTEDPGEEPSYEEDAGTFGADGSVYPPEPPPPDDREPFDPNILVRTNGRCEALSQVQAEPSPYDGAPLDLTVREALNGTSSAMVGTWVGTAHSPWQPESWPLLLTLRADGTYDAQTFHGGEAPAFYYGSDLPCELKRWRLDHVSLDGVGGQIDVPFAYPPEACYLPGWQGELHDIVFDAHNERMRFDFSRDDGYGPVVYELFRTCD